MRIADIITTAGGNLGRNKARTFLTITAIFIGTLTLTMTNGVGSGISLYIDKQLGNLGAEDILVIMPQGEQSPFGSANEDAPRLYDPERTVAGLARGFVQPVLTQTDIRRLESDVQLLEVTPMLVAAPDYISTYTSKKYQITVSPFIDGTNLDMVAGNRPNNSSSVYEIVLPVNYPEALGFTSAEAVGRTVILAISDPGGVQYEVEVRIAGVQQKSLMTLAGASINNALNERLFTIQTEGLPDALKEQYQAAIAKFDQSLSEQQVTALKNKLKGMGYLAQTVQDRIGIVKQVIGGIILVFNLFGLIALVAAAFGIINTLLMAVTERTKEIGLMKSMGMSGNKIFLLFSIEAALLGLWGSILGTAAAIGIAVVVNRQASSTFLAAFPGLDLLAFPVLSSVGIIVMIIFIAFLAGVLPAVRAARKNPIEALRYE